MGRNLRVNKFRGFARNRENREIYIPSKFSRPTVCHLVHISNISLNYSHLKSTRPLVSKSKVVRPGSGCDAYVGVSKIKMGVSRSGCGFGVFLFAVCFNLYMQPNSHTSHFEIMKAHVMKTVATAIHKLKRSSAMP